MISDGVTSKVLDPNEVKVSCSIVESSIEITLTQNFTNQESINMGFSYCIPYESDFCIHDVTFIHNRDIIKPSLIERKQATKISYYKNKQLSIKFDN